MFKIGNSICTINGVCTTYVPPFNITYGATNGNVSGPATALHDTTVSVTAIPSADCTYQYITVNGVQQTALDFTMPKADVTVHGYFEAPWPDLPQRSFRVRTEGSAPIYGRTGYWTHSAVPGHEGVYDVVCTGMYTDDADDLFKQSNVVEWIGANLSSNNEETYPSINAIANLFYGCTGLERVQPLTLTSITYAGSMFESCGYLTSVGDLNLSAATDINYTFRGCSRLTALPHLTLGNSLETNGSFYYCPNVESGISAMYAYLSGRSTSHYYTFQGCGTNTEQGRAELAQIPSDWK